MTDQPKQTPEQEPPRTLAVPEVLTPFLSTSNKSAGSEADFKLTKDERERIQIIMGQVWRGEMFTNTAVDEIERIINEGWRNCLTQDD